MVGTDFSNGFSIQFRHDRFFTGLYTFPLHPSSRFSPAPDPGVADDMVDGGVLVIPDIVPINYTAVDPSRRVRTPDRQPQRSRAQNPNPLPMISAELLTHVLCAFTREPRWAGLRLR